MEGILKPVFCFLCGKEYVMERPGPTYPPAPIIGPCCQKTEAATHFRDLYDDILELK